MSAGLIPAAATRFQRALGIVDSAEQFAADIRRKAHDEGNSPIAELVARESGPTVEWLADRYGLPFSLVHDFNYPGHSARRMHGLPSRSGAELIDRLNGAAEQAAITIVAEATVSALFADVEGVIRGFEVTRPDGSCDRIGCEALILACNGYGGAPDLVANTFRKCAPRSILVTRAIAATRCYGAGARRETFEYVRVSGPRFGR